MCFLRLAFISFCFLVSRFAFGQELHFIPFEPSPTLPSSEAYHLLQDSKGYIWISTDAGVCRYDGNKLRIYTVVDGISENVVFNIYEDLHGRIWFSTLSGYFFYYENGRFTQIAANNELKKVCNSYTINSFFVGEKDTLFCSTSSVNGLLKIPPQNNYKQIIHMESPYYNCNRFLLQNKINPSESLMGCGPGKVNNKEGSYIANCSDTSFTITLKNILVASGNCWNGKCSKNGDIYLPTGNILSVIRKATGAIEDYHFNESISWIYEDHDGDLWLGIKKNGGYLYKKGDLKSIPVHFLDTYTISGFLLDREGTVWVSTLEKGVFQCLTKRILDIYIPDDKVADFHIEDNQLLTGWSSNKIFTFSKDKNGYSENNIQLPAYNFLNCFYLHKSENYLADGIDLFYSGQKFANFLPVLFKTEHLSIKTIIPLAGDTILTVSSGNVYIVYKNKTLDQIPVHFRIGCIVKLKNNDVLIGSKNNSGIYLLKNKSLLPFLAKYPELKTRVNFFKEDEAGNLWIATNEKGLFCIDKKGTLHKFNEINGLASNKINIFDFDKSNAMWLGTNKGLTKLVFVDGFKDVVISNFNKTHGLPALEIDRLIAYDGKIWCGTKEHLFYFQCNQMKPNLTRPYTYLKSVTINGNIFNSSLPKLNYDQNNINIEFEGITYKSNEQKEFIYKLEGYDNQWKYSNTGAVQYTNLNYGKYHFFVYALNNDKLKSFKPAEFSFEIEKPFWFCWWFILTEFIVLYLIVYFTAKTWSGKIKKRETEKTFMNQKMAEFHMTALRAQMNPHFVFNAISSIQHYILKNDPYESYNYLAKFSLLIRNVLDNSQEEYISMIKEIETLRLYIELEQIRFKQPFEFTFEIDPALNTEENLIPTMLIQPYIENAIWHGLMPKQNDCKLSVVFQKGKNDLRIIITDNGIGREASNKSKGDQQHVSKGMSLSNERLEALKIKNKKLFSLKIIDLKDKNGLACGTQIIITIPVIEF